MYQKGNRTFITSSISPEIASKLQRMAEEDDRSFSYVLDKVLKTSPLMQS